MQLVAVGGGAAGEVEAVCLVFLPHDPSRIFIVVSSILGRPLLVTRDRNYLNSATVVKFAIYLAPKYFSSTNYQLFASVYA